MNLYVGITDGQWFEQLQELRPDEVNFWKPGGETAFRALSPGELFLFKLHSPDNFIVGGGHFVSFSFLPVSLAWDAFGVKNGVIDRRSFVQRIARYRRSDVEPNSDPTVGCIILNQPFFFSREEWIPAPANWPSSTVQGKTYSLETADGAAMWREVASRLEGVSVQTPMVVHESPATYQATARLGQGAFRVLVTDAYSRRCAITGERTLPALEAAHIVPYAQEPLNRVSNGLLLRADLHKLFDLGLVTVTPEYRVKISPSIRERFENGRDYYALDNSELRILPARPDSQPDRERLAWHNRSVYND